MTISRAVPNVEYTIETSSDLSSGSWASVATTLGESFTLSGSIDGGTISLPAASSGSENQFYRLAQTGIDLPAQQ